MKKWTLPIFYSLVSSKLAFASGGFTFFSSLAHSLHLPEHIITYAFVLMMILLSGGIYRLGLSKKSNLVMLDPGITFRNIIESYGKFVYSQCQAIIGPVEGPKYFTFIAALFLCILANNLIGLIPGFSPATQNINTTLAMGIFSFAYYNYMGCKELGTAKYLKHFMGPLWYMAVLVFPIEIISNLVRPISLALRLRGNIFGDHLVMGIFGDLAPLVIPIAFLMLGLLVSFIQAYVFSVLTMVYISLATAHHDHAEH